CSGPLLRQTAQSRQPDQNFSRVPPAIFFPNCRPLIARSSLYGDPSIRWLSKGSSRMLRQMTAAFCGVGIIFAFSVPPKAAVKTVNLGTGREAHSDVDKLQPFIGAASTYNPFRPGPGEGGKLTASGENYSANSWTAAIQTNLRRFFSGVFSGKAYRPRFALVETANKRAVIKINDVGPVKAGRIIDLNEQAMQYFDPTMQRGVIKSVKVTPLPGEGWIPGPV